MRRQPLDPETRTGPFGLLTLRSQRQFQSSLESASVSKQLSNLALRHHELRRETTGCRVGTERPGPLISVSSILIESH